MLLISERDDIEGAKRVSRQEGREEYSGRNLLQGLFIGVLERERERDVRAQTMSAVNYNRFVWTVVGQEDSE